MKTLYAQIVLLLCLLVVDGMGYVCYGLTNYKLIRGPSETMGLF